MVVAASTADERVEQAALAPASADKVPVSVRIPDRVPLPAKRPEPKIVVDLK